MKQRFDMIGLFVSDLPAMVGFYRDVIGISIEWNGEGPYAEFNHEGYDSRCMRGECCLNF